MSLIICDGEGLLMFDGNACTTKDHRNTLLIELNPKSLTYRFAYKLQHIVQGGPQITHAGSDAYTE